VIGDLRRIGRYYSCLSFADQCCRHIVRRSDRQDWAACAQVFEEFALFWLL
jgi:hypothetical protein